MTEYTSEEIDLLTVQTEGQRGPFLITSIGTVESLGYRSDNSLVQPR